MATLTDNSALLIELAKSVQIISSQLNGLHSTHQKGATSYANLVTAMAQDNWISQDHKTEKKSLKQLSESVKLSRRSISQLTELNQLLRRIEATQSRVSDED